MEIKAIIAVQFLLNLFLAAIFLLRLREERTLRKLKKSRRARSAGVMEGLRRWEAISSELTETMAGKVREMESLSEELDRAEIRARQTLKKLGRVQSSWASNWETYGRCLGWIREGLPLEEVAKRSGVSLDELRLIQGLSSSSRSAG